MNDQNERNDPSRQDPSNSDRERSSSQGQASSGQAEQSQRSSDLSERQDEALTSPDHEQGAMGGSVTAAGGSSTGPGAGSAGLERDKQGFVGNQESDSGGYLQQDRRDQPNQGGFAEEGQGAPEDSEPGGIEGLGGERSEDSDSESDIEGSSRT